MPSKVAYINDVETPKANKMAKSIPRVETKDHEQQIDNGSDHKDKNEEEDNRESEKDDTERRDALINHVESAHDLGVVQATSDVKCEKSDKNIKVRKD